MVSVSQIAGLGGIAQRLGVSIHRVAYLIRTRKIEPLLVVGGRKLYSEAAVQRIAGELKRIDAGKRGAAQ